MKGYKNKNILSNIYQHIFQFYYYFAYNFHSGCTPLDLDIVVVIDGSANTCNRYPAFHSYDNWDILTDFAAAIIDRLPRTGTQVGVFVFNAKVKVAIPLNKHSNLWDAAQATHSLLNPREYIPISRGIYIDYNEVFDLRNGDRPDVPNLVIVITVNPANPSFGNTTLFTMDLHRVSTRVISIGVGEYPDETLLQAMSSPPQKKGSDFFTVPEYFKLFTIIDTLIGSIYSKMPENGAPLLMTSRSTSSKPGRHKSYVSSFSQSPSCNSNNDC